MWRKVKGNVPHEFQEIKQFEMKDGTRVYFEYIPQQDTVILAMKREGSLNNDLLEKLKLKKDAHPEYHG